jgi:ABC-2 type transport system ATP-binding protein
VTAAAVVVEGLARRYGDRAVVDDVSLAVDPGEIVALLGPNGAGKTTLINIVCGIVTPSAGSVSVGGHDIVRDYRAARSLIGLVPQELAITPFETVWQTVNFSRGLFGKPADAAFTEKILRDVALWDRRHSKIVTLSGGMKRRVLIAKALVHEPQVLFLDEPTAGVDVELRQDMWQVVRKLREAGVTIILTTHYIEEAELMADRVAVINKGEIILVEEKHALMHKMGKKQLTLHLLAPLHELPAQLSGHNLTLAANRRDLIYTYDTQAERTGITRLLDDLDGAGIEFRDLETTQSSLEDIFVHLVHDK